MRYNIWKCRFYIWKIGYYAFVFYNKIKFNIILGKNCGSHLVVAGKLYVMLGNKNSRLTIGNHFHSLNGNNYNPLSRNITGAINVEPNGEVVIGDWVGMSSVSIRCKSKIIIGNNVNIGADSVIMDTDAHSLDYNDRRRNINNKNDKENTKTNPICIGNDVFIGMRCIIMKGVTIGDRSIIGAGSVVTTNIPSDSLAVGNPCKVVRCLSK